MSLKEEVRQASKWGQAGQWGCSSSRFYLVNLLGEEW